jgi:hypothetical protein
MGKRNRDEMRGGGGGRRRRRVIAVAPCLSLLHASPKKMENDDMCQKPPWKIRSRDYPIVVL